VESRGELVAMRQPGGVVGGAEVVTKTDGNLEDVGWLASLVVLVDDVRKGYQRIGEDLPAHVGH